MSLTYRIFPDLGLVYVRYEGMVDLDATARVFADYMQNPQFRPGQKQFVDLSGVTGFSSDFTRLLAVQALKAEAFHGPAQTLMVYYAPTPKAQAMAHLAARSWDDIDSVAAVVQTREEDALTVLGLTQTSLDALLRRPA